MIQVQNKGVQGVRCSLCGNWCLIGFDMDRYYCSYCQKEIRYTSDRIDFMCTNEIQSTVSEFKEEFNVGKKEDKHAENLRKVYYSKDNVKKK
jgi:hypothetical protein